jgi:hypothetical protein
MTSYCNLSVYIPMILFGVSYLLWAPWVIRERVAPLWVRSVAWVLVVAGVLMAVVWMPMACAERGV